MPSGRRFPFAFGMNTRLTGMACYGDHCTSVTRRSLPADDSTTCLSTPGVRRPALRSVTCRTDQRVRQAPEHQLLQAADSLVIPSLRRREIRRRSRRTWSSAARQSTASQSGATPSGPFTPAPLAGGTPASNLSLGSNALVIRSLRRPTWPRPTSAPFRVRAAARIRPVIRDGQRRSRPTRPGFLPPFGHRHSLAGPSCPAEEFRLPHGRPTSHRLDLDGVSTFRTHESRSGGCLLYPGAVVPTQPERNVPVGTRRFSAASPEPLPLALTGRGPQSRGISEGSRDSPVRSSSRPYSPG